VGTRETAEIQVVLEGVDLPARKKELLAYASSQDERAAGVLQSLPDREYRSIDEVAEALSPVQPSSSHANAHLPRDESGKPPGGDAYLDADAEPGAVRPSGPSSNPPQKALEEQTKSQKQQQERQQHLG
jgi:Protein of unknown function (DUF2795)